MKSKDTYIWVLPQGRGALNYRVIHQKAVALDTFNALEAVVLYERLINR